MIFLKEQKCIHIQNYLLAIQYPWKSKHFQYFFILYHLLLVMSNQASASSSNSLNSPETPKNKQVIHTFNLNEYVDINDYHGEWRAAIIIEKNQQAQYYKIRIDGFNNKSDEIIKFNSQKIVEFRAQTIGYTGPKNTFPIRQHLKFQLEEHDKKYQQLNNFLTKNIYECSAYYIRQFARGRHFFYTDFLLNSSFESGEVLTKVIIYLKASFDLAIKYFIFFEKTLERNQHVSKKDYQKQEAFIQAQYQIFDNITMILSTNNTMRHSFYKSNTTSIHEILSSQNKYETFDSYSRDLFLRFLEQAHFFQRVTEFLHALNRGYEKVSLQFYRSFILFYSKLDHIFRLSDINIKFLLELIKKRLTNLSETDLKISNRQLISDLIKKLKNLLEIRQIDKMEIQYMEELEIIISYKYFKSSSFDRRLKGLTSIKDILQKINQNKEFKFISSKIFYKWAIQKSYFLKEVLSDPHLEIVKRAIQIIKLFCINETIDQQVIDLIWECRMEKHQTIVRAMNDIIIQLVELLKNNKLINYIFEKIKNRNIQNWDEDYLDLVKGFCYNCMKACPNFQGLDLIYQYWLYKKNDSILQSLYYILFRQSTNHMLVKYITICVRSIQNNVNVDMHLKLFLKLTANNEKLPSLENYEDSDILQIILNYIMEHHENAQRLELLLQLVDNLINCYHELNLQKQQIERLWETLKQDQQAFHLFKQWLIQQDDDQKQIRINFMQETKIYIFQQLICNDENNRIGTNLFQYELFETFFKDIYNQNKYMKNKSIYRFDVKIIDTFALDKLWSILLNCTDIKVNQAVSQLLCEVYHNIPTELQIKRSETHRQLINYAIKQITHYKQISSFTKVKRCLELIKRFMYKVEGRFIYYTTINKPISRKDIQLINHDDPSHHEQILKFNVNLPLGMLRNQIADRLQVPPILVKLYYNKTNTITQDFDKKQYSQLKIPFTLQYSISKQKYNRTVEEELTKNFGLLFDLLETQIGDTVWDILKRLPKYDKYIFEIEFLSKPLEELFTGNLYKELYLLQIIEKQNDAWWQRLISKNNIMLFIRKLDTQINNQISRRYIKLIARIIVKYITKSGSDFLENRQCMVEKALNCLINFGVYLKKRDNHPRIEHPQVTFQQENQILKQIFCLLDKLKCIKNFFAHPKIKEILHNFLLNHNTAIKTIVFKQFIILIKQPSYNAFTNDLIHYLFGNFLKYIIEKSLPTAYFKSLSELIDAMKLPQLKMISAQSQLFLYLIQVLQKQNEIQSNIINENCSGIIMLLKSLIDKRELKIENTHKNKLLKFLLQDGLFNFTNIQIPPKFKTTTTRINAFLLIICLISSLPDSLKDIFNFLNPYQKYNSWRTRNIYDWAIVVKNQKLSHGYVGIENLGCICYMNSFLQQMFMIPSFYRKVLCCQDPSIDKLKKEDNLLFQLKSMFIALKKSQKQSYNPYSFCNAFKDAEGKSVNISEQMDIDQFSSIFFDKLQNQIKGTPDQNFIKDHFGGVMANQIVCKGCPHYSQKQESFLSLSLQVKNKKDIYQSLQTMIKGEILEGQNAYFCDKCNKKVSAIKRVCLKKLPNHLIIVLKRIQFNYQNMNKIKINDFCEFPRSLNLYQYSEQALRTNKQSQNLNFHEQSYFQYQLKGTVIHHGYADGGHYYSLIQERTGQKKWYCFNDNLVKQFDVQSLGQESFGGEEKVYENRVRQKIHNAYILIYDRKQIQIKMIEQLKKQEKIVDCNNVVQRIKRQNQKFNIKKLIFSKDYEQFIKYIMMNLYQANNHKSIQILKFVLTYCFCVAFREKQKKFVYEFLPQNIDKIIKSKEISIWILAIFNDVNYIREFFLYNPIVNIRKLLANLFIEIIKNVVITSIFRQNSIEYIVLNNLINSILRSLLQKNVYNNLYTNQLFQILYKICLLKNQFVIKLLEKKSIGRILQIIQQGQLKLFNDLSDLKNIQIIQFECLLGNVIQKDDQREVSDKQRVYVWCLLSQLLKNCQLYKQHYYPDIEKTRYTLSVQQYHIVNSWNPKYIKIWLNQVNSKLGIRKLCDYLRLLCIEDKNDKSNMLIEIIQYELISQIYLHFRVYFLVFKMLINISDRNQELRMQGIRNILKALQSNQQYFYEANVIHQWLLKIIKKSEQFQAFLKRNRDYCQTILNSISLSKPSSKRSIDKNKNQQHHQIIHGIQFPRCESKVQQLIEKIQNDFSCLRRGESLIDDDDWDSDDDLSQKKIQLNQTIYVYLQKSMKFKEGIIRSIFSDFLKIEVEKCLIDYLKDSQYLALNYKLKQENQNQEESNNTTEEATLINQ